MSSVSVDINREFGELTDEVALRAEIDGIRDCLEAGVDLLTLERECAIDIHIARAKAISDSPAMRLVFNYDDEKPVTERPSTDDLLASAFGKKVVSGTLPEGMSHALRRNLRAFVHPDIGGDHAVASKVGSALENLEKDEVFAAATALIASKTPTPKSLQELRDERYQLTLSLGAVETVFGSEEEARSHAEAEIAATEWRIRAEAGLKTIGLLLGSSDVWHSFLESIVKHQKMSLVTMINRIQPELLSLQERIAKGDPIKLDSSAIEDVDSVLERIWSTLGNKDDDSLPYTPPYQNWLDIFMPALRILDPGEKPGEHYTRFPKPIQISQPAPPPTNRYGQKNLGDLYGKEKTSGYSSNIRDNSIYSSYNEERNSKY